MTDYHAPTAYRVMSRRGAEELCVGTVHRNARGWMFIPHFQADPSRKAWASPQGAIGRRVRDYRLVPYTPLAKESA